MRDMTTVNKQRIRAVSALLLTSEGKLVAQLRDDKPGLPYPNCWSTLGGRIEDGEQPDEAMRRELIEEIEFCPLVHFWQAFDLDYLLDGRPTTSEVLVYVGQLDRDLSAIRLHEGQRLAAFGVDDLADLSFAFGLDRLYYTYFDQKNGAQPLHFTLATLDEAELVHRLMREAFAEYEGVLQPSSGATHETVADVRQAMSEGGAVLAWRGDEAVGSARFLLEPDALYVGRVSVPPAYRKQGIGQAIMCHMETIARQYDRPKIRVGVRMSLPQNVTFYQRLGYEIVRIEPHPRGRGEQFATLIKRVSPEEATS